MKILWMIAGIGLVIWGILINVFWLVLLGGTILYLSGEKEDHEATE